MNIPSPRQASTLFLKLVLILIGGSVLAFCAYFFPYVWVGATKEWPISAYVLYPGLICIFATIIPFLFALLQAFRLLQYIDRNHAFSEPSILALRTITFCAVAMSVLYWMGMPLVFALADLDDAPGGVLIGAAFASAPLVVATFAAVLQKLVRSALALKIEQDFTI